MKNFSIFDKNGKKSGDKTQGTHHKAGHHPAGHHPAGHHPAGHHPASHHNVHNAERCVQRIYNLIILDESGSMYTIYDEALTGVNETLQTIREAEKQNKGQKQFVSLVAFDTSHYNEIFRLVPASRAHDITRKDYYPNGGTPLYDAMGRALTELAHKVKEDDLVLVTVITDGYENASHEYTESDIRMLVEMLKSKGWVFTYIGANQDAAAVGATIAITNTLNFTQTSEGTKEMWQRERESRSRFFSRMANEIDRNAANLNEDYFDRD